MLAEGIIGLEGELTSAARGGSDFLSALFRAASFSLAARIEGLHVRVLKMQLLNYGSVQFTWHHQTFS